MIALAIIPEVLAALALAGVVAWQVAVHKVGAADCRNGGAR